MGVMQEEPSQSPGEASAKRGSGSNQSPAPQTALHPAPQTAPQPTPSSPLPGPPVVSQALALACGLIKEFEGFRAEPYQDSKGVWTIGYGNTRELDGREVGPETRPVSEDEALAMMMGVVKANCQELWGMLKVSVSPGEAGALLSLGYNIGMEALRESSIIRLCNSGLKELAGEHFLGWVYEHDPESGAWVKLPGLVKRREAELKVWQGE